MTAQPSSFRRLHPPGGMIFFREFCVPDPITHYLLLKDVMMFYSLIVKTILVFSGIPGHTAAKYSFHMAPNASAAPMRSLIPAKCDTSVSSGFISIVGRPDRLAAIIGPLM